MLRIAICDDDLGFTGRLETLVLEESQSMGIRVDTDVFSDGKTLLKSIQSGERYGLIFIDIEMEQVDGISAARKIRETAIRCCSYIFQDMINILRNCLR